MPPQSVLEYARRVLSDAGWLAASLVEAKVEAVREFTADYADEIAALAYGTLHFFERKGVPAIFAELEGGRDFRCWRIEFTSRKCEGIGFDS